MILVTGATGKLGGGVIQHLLKRGVSPSNILVLVRDRSKAQIFEEQGIKARLGDYNNPESLLQAFQDVNKLFLISSNDRGEVSNRTQHHKQAIQAAKNAGVAHTIYTSFVRKEAYAKTAIADFQQSHVDTEQYLKDSGMTYTLLQNGIYSEMMLAFMGEKLLQREAIFFPAGSGEAHWTLRDELAEGAAHVLTTGGHENKIYTLAQTESMGFEAIAQLVSHISGQKIAYSSPEIDVFKSTLEKQGVPEVFIQMLSQWGAAISQNALQKSDETLASFLGRKPTRPEKFIAQTFASP